jgi:hypothetical protein
MTLVDPAALVPSHANVQFEPNTERIAAWTPARPAVDPPMSTTVWAFAAAVKQATAIKGRIIFFIIVFYILMGFFVIIVSD